MEFSDPRRGLRETSLPTLYCRALSHKEAETFFEALEADEEQNGQTDEEYAYAKPFLIVSTLARDKDGAEFDNMATLDGLIELEKSQLGIVDEICHALIGSVQQRGKTMLTLSTAPKESATP